MNAMETQAFKTATKDEWYARHLRDSDRDERNITREQRCAPFWRVRQSYAASSTTGYIEGDDQVNTVVGYEGALRKLSQRR